MAIGQTKADGIEAMTNNGWIRSINELNEKINTEFLPVYTTKAVKEGKLNVTFECNPGQGPKAAELIQRLESDISIDKEQYVEETYFDGTMDLDEIIENRTY